MRFTTEGLFEPELNIGDKLRVGSAVVMVTEPRMPCYKLGIKFDSSDIVRSGSWRASARGFIFAVVQEGGVEWDDSIKLIEKSERQCQGDRYHPAVYPRETQRRVASSGH